MPATPCPRGGTLTISTDQRRPAAARPGRRGRRRSRRSCVALACAGHRLRHGRRRRSRASSSRSSPPKGRARAPGSAWPPSMASSSKAAARSRRERDGQGKRLHGSPALRGGAVDLPTPAAWPASPHRPHGERSWWWRMRRWSGSSSAPCCEEAGYDRALRVTAQRGASGLVAERRADIDLLVTDVVHARDARPRTCPPSRPISAGDESALRLRLLGKRHQRPGSDSGRFGYPPKAFHSAGPDPQGPRRFCTKSA